MPLLMPASRAPNRRSQAERNKKRAARNASVAPMLEAKETRISPGTRAEYGAGC